MPVLAGGYVHAERPQGARAARARPRHRATFTPATTPGGSTSPRWTGRSASSTAPAVIVANAGEVNAGDFDPIAEMADLAERARRLAARRRRVRPVRARLAAHGRTSSRGVERARLGRPSTGTSGSTCPYDCGFAFVRDHGCWAGRSAPGRGYLPPPEDDPRPNYGILGPETSRRARALPSGRRCARTAGRGTGRWSSATSTSPCGSRARVEEAPDLELLAPVRLEHRLLPLPPARRRRGGARRAEPPARRGAYRRRPGLRRHHDLPRA